MLHAGLVPRTSKVCCTHRAPHVEVRRCPPLGVFYGGHDNVDIFVRCLCNTCAKKLPVAADEGGCIFNCCQVWLSPVCAKHLVPEGRYTPRTTSQFEKHAGLGHRKKWKESVRYADRRVVDHLKDRSAALGGEALVGSLLWVCWLRERAFYLGVVRSWDPREGTISHHPIPYQTLPRRKDNWVDSLLLHRQMYEVV